MFGFDALSLADDIISELLIGNSGRPLRIPPPDAKQLVIKALYFIRFRCGISDRDLHSPGVDICRSCRRGRRGIFPRRFVGAFTFLQGAPPEISVDAEARDQGIVTEALGQAHIRCFGQSFDDFFHARAQIIRGLLPVAGKEDIVLDFQASDAFVEACQVFVIFRHLSSTFPQQI